MEGNNDEMWFLDDDYVVEDEEQLVDEGEHDVPFNVADVPQQLVTADAHTQREVHLGLYEQQPASGRDHVTKFKASGVKGMRMSTLKSMHDNKRAMAAVGLLRQRHRITMDGEYTVDVNGANMVACVGPHYLDYVLYVGSRRGMDAAIPRLEVDHHWNAKLQLNLSTRLWPDTQMRALPFNPEGWMMALGTCMDEQLWLAMALNMYFEEGYGENREEVIPVLESKMTALSTEHRYMMIMFIAHVLDSMRHEDIHCIVEYPEPLTLESIKASTEVLGRFEEWHRNIKLRLNDMKAFHRHFINSWAEWVRKAPASWKQDGFLVENMPVGVCLQYGQNQPIMVSQAVEEERTNWSRDRNFRYIRQISFSLATHISYLDVQRWHNVSLERITWNHGEVYDKPDHDPSRVAVDLRELDLLGEDGYEINMYNKAGWRVPRQVPKESESCGALLDLDKVHELFQGRDEVHGEMTNEVEFWVYPLAFTQKYGNVKAHGIIPNMAARVGKLNESIFRGGMEDDDMDIDEGGEDRVRLARRHPAIHGIASQIYNSLSHRVRNEAKFHSVQLGMITSAFAGAGIETAGGRRRSIYEEIICPLLKAWSHPQVLGRIKDSLKLFKADIIPELFKCATYPVTALIEMIWAKHKQDLQDKRNIDACTVEVMLMLERTLNFAHTGNAAVLSTRLMDRAWLSLRLLSDGFPALSDTFIAHGALSMGQVTAYEAKFTIKLAVENLPPNAYSHISNASFRQACYAADVAFRVYFDDVKKLVREGVTAATTPLLRSEDQLTRQSARERLTALGRWMDERHPLSYMPGILSNLLQAILAPNERKFELTTLTLGKKPTSFIADIVIKQCSKVMAHNIPPFIKGGNFIHVARVAVEEMKNAGTHAGHSGGDLTGFVADAICAACEHLKINHVPWSCNPTGGAGRPSNVVVHDVWLNLGGQAPPVMGSQSMNVPAQQSNSAMAYQASQAIQAGDTRGEWSAMDVRLTSFDTVLHKINLPSDWALAHIEVEGMPEYILDGYRFMQNTYDGAKPLHQLAMICAILCAGLLPSIFSPKNKTYPTSKVRYAEYLEKLDWVERDRKGNKEHGRFITMVSGFIICLYEANSPISQRVRSRGDLKEWWAKHTAKGINAFLLACLGLASIETASGFRSAKWTVDIKPCGGDKIVMRHAEVVRLMKSGGTYGGFDAVQYLAGMKAANILQTNQFVTARALPGMAQASTSSKRSREEWDEGHDDDGIVPCGSHGMQRKASRHD
ncbi:hypothetical protein EDC04DRAFT_2896712 [Pisolithus marmoratus]|nr:hypothetical protein EDC04DRAFT_2896712 [Pisolithus marmoratus]